MVWVIIFLFAGAGLIIAGSRRMRIPRIMGREGPEDAEVVKGYDRLSRWPIMSAERYLALRELKNLNPAGILVDVGCGPGYLVDNISRSFPQLHVIGVDINEDMLRQARNNFHDRHIEFQKGDAQALIFENNKIDFMVSTGAFHHWASGLRSLREFHRVLKPGGQFLVLDLRRDMPRIFYWLVKLIQMFMPADIKRVNGAVGSVWSSYTVDEVLELMRKSPFSKWRLKPAPGWMFVWGQKQHAILEPGSGQAED